MNLHERLSNTWFSSCMQALLFCRWLTTHLGRHWVSYGWDIAFMLRIFFSFQDFTGMSSLQNITRTTFMQDGLEMCSDATRAWKALLYNTELTWNESICRPVRRISCTCLPRPEGEPPSCVMNEELPINYIHVYHGEPITKESWK